MNIYIYIYNYININIYIYRHTYHIKPPHFLQNFPFPIPPCSFLPTAPRRPRLHYPNPCRCRYPSPQYPWLHRAMAWVGSSIANLKCAWKPKGSSKSLPIFIGILDTQSRYPIAPFRSHQSWRFFFVFPGQYQTYQTSKIWGVGYTKHFG